MRVEDAMHATRAAYQEGILPGGGVALLRASAGLKIDGLSPDEEAGYKIVVRACRAPIIQIVANAGENGDVVANNILENKNVNYGYDARLSTYGDLVKEGIIDPTKVVQQYVSVCVFLGSFMLNNTDQ